MTGNSPEDFREFLKSMISQDAQRYAGEWIAFAGGEIVAHGKDPRRVNTEGRKAGKGGGAVHAIHIRKPGKGAALVYCTD